MATDTTKAYVTGSMQYEATLNHIREGFQLISFDWVYLYVNDAVVKQSKYCREELLGHTMMDRYPGMENTALFQVLKECMLLRITKNFDNEFTFPDQSKGWFELRIQPVPDGIFILSADITERRRLEEEKRAYMAGLETMIFMTSHRLRHPVSQILGISNLLDENVVSSEDVKKITAYMKESALSLDAFTSELTSFINHLKVKGKAVEESVIEY